VGVSQGKARASIEQEKRDVKQGSVLPERPRGESKDETVKGVRKVEGRLWGGGGSLEEDRQKR